MADIDRIRREDVELTVERFGRKYEVTATHRPTGASVTRDGISFNITRNDALVSLEERVAELEDGADGEEEEDEADD